jgi:quercetin dioxygenase-like cupin family protein
MKVLSHGPAAQPDRPATELLHDENNARIIAFHLQPGQQVKPHRSESTVFVQVVAGGGWFRGESTQAYLTAGEGAVYEPGELHSIDAGDTPLRFLAIITPRPAS